MVWFSTSNYNYPFARKANFEVSGIMDPGIWCVETEKEIENGKANS